MEYLYYSLSISLIKYFTSLCIFAAICTCQRQVYISLSKPLCKRNTVVI